MSKTASSASSVGASFENTTAIMATMQESTRESSKNIGTALKSIISRYGELKSDPRSLMDSEGEELSLNKVDKALQSVGITLQTADGQFRDFDDVIIELASHWKELDSISQRYIATVVAGNRQQSRLLAFLSNYDRFLEIQEGAMNSEDAGLIQSLKTMDSITTKWTQLQTAFQEFYTSTGVQDLIKGILDAVTTVLNRLNTFSKAFGKLPVLALAQIGVIVKSLKTAATLMVTHFSNGIEQIKAKFKQANSEIAADAQQKAKGVFAQIADERYNQGGGLRGIWGALKSGGTTTAAAGIAMSSLGAIASIRGLSDNNSTASAWKQGIGSVFSGVGSGLLTFSTTANPIFALISAITTAIPGVINAFRTGIKSTEEKLKELQQSIEDSKNQALLSKDELKTLTDYEKKLKEAKAAQYDSVEAKQEYYNLMNEIADKYPQLITNIDDEKNAIVELGDSYKYYKEQKEQAYFNDTIASAAKTISARRDKDYRFDEAASSIIPDSKSAYSERNLSAYLNYQSIFEYFDEHVGAMWGDYFKSLEENDINGLTTRGVPRGILQEVYPDLDFEAMSIEELQQKAVEVLSTSSDPLIQILNAIKNTASSYNDYVKKSDRATYENVVRNYASTKGIKMSDFEVSGYVDKIQADIDKQIQGKDRKEAEPIIENFLKFQVMSGEVFTQYDNIFKDLNDKQKELIDELGDKAATYSTNELREKVVKIIGEDNPEIITAIMDYFASLLEWTKEDFVEALRQRGGAVSQSLIDNLSTASQQKMIGLMDKAKDKDQKSAYQVLYQGAASITDSDLRRKAENVLNSADLTSFTGIWEAKKSIEEFGQPEIFGNTLKALDNLKDSIDVNFEIEMSSYIDSVTKKVDEFGELFSKMNKGLSLGDAMKRAEAMEVDFDEAFDFKEGKYFLKDTFYDTFENYYLQLNEDMIKEMTDKARESGMKEEEIEKLTQDLRRAAQEYATYTVTSSLIEARNYMDLAGRDGFLKEGVSIPDFISAVDSGDIKKALSLMTEEAAAIYGEAMITQLTDPKYGLLSSLISGISTGSSFKVTANQAELNSLKNNGFDIIAKTTDGAYIQLNNIAEAYKWIDLQLANGSFSPERYNELRKNINATKFSAPIAKALSSFDDIHRITEEELENYADSIGISAKDLEAAMTRNEDGTYSASLTSLANAVYKVGGSLADVGIDATIYVENLSTYIDNLSAMFDKALNGATFSEAFKIAGSRGKSITELFERDGDKYFLKSDQTEEFVNGYLQSILDGLEAYGVEISNELRDEATKAAKEQAASALSDNGNYLEALQVYAYGNKKKQAEIAQAYKKGDVNKLRELTKGFDISGNIIDAMGNQVKDVYTDVIDALQNGRLLKAESGTRDIYQRLAQNGLLTKVGQDLYKVSENTGLQFLQAITEEMALTEDQLADLITSNIQNLAENANLTSFAREAQENAQKATGKVRNAWLDSINSIFSDTSGRISNGIKGSASANDIGTLEKQFGFGISYSRTEEGFKIKQESLNQMYNTLKSIDDISASIVLTNLISSAMESEESLNDVWYVMNKIEELEKELANPKVSDKRKKELEAELDVAQGIYNTLKKADGTFNFMKKDLPSGYDEPLSAWEGVNDAFKVLESDDYKKGYVTIQDFTNMVTMMGDDVLRTCGIFNDDISTSADLLLAANNAITRVDGEVMVDLSQLGVNFNVGADNMKKGVTEGIHTLAEQQIAILDAEIEMLQTVVKTQEAFDKLKGDKTELTAEDFMPIISEDPTLPAAWKENQKEAVEAVSKFAGDLILKCGITLREAASDPNKLALLDEADYELMASIANALSKTDWVGMTGETARLIQDKINTALQEGGYDYRIKIDMSKLNISFASGEINWDDETLAPLLDYKDEIEAYLKEHPEQVTVSLNDLIKIAAGDDEDLTNQLTGQLTTTLTTVKDELNPAIEGAKTNAQETQESVTSLGEQSFDNFKELKTDTERIRENLRRSTIYAKQVNPRFKAVAFDDGTGGGKGTTGEKGHSGSSSDSTLPDFSTIITDLQTIYDKLKDITSNSNIVNTLESLVKTLDALGKTISSIPAAKASNEMKVLQASISALRSKAITLGATIILKVQATGAIRGSIDTIRGNVSSGRGGFTAIDIESKKNNDHNRRGLSKGTLMGELGPELVVSGGRYFTVGENGAEFVSLADDAIVFNHLQTKQLLGKGSTGRGRAVTNEKNATSYATGNAKASAAEALQELINIRAQWQALLNKSAKDLGQKAGGGGGGGGGGNDPKTITHDLERWYNLLRQIEKLEQKITLQQAKRANMKNGYDYVDSLEKELGLLRKQQKAYSDLARLQKDYYDKRRKDLLSTDYSKIFTYDEDGLMQYVDGENRGLDVLAKLLERNPKGEYVNAAVNSTSQLAYLKSIGFDTSSLNFNADGSTAEEDDQRMQNFWDNLDAWMEELDGLYDEYNEHLQSVEENTAKQNELLQEYIDNQLTVEGKILTAIEDREQAIIDKLQDEKDALEKASQNYIDGLNKALKKEKNLYNSNQDAAETARLQRQLAILQRSGASTSEIKSLQDQIDNRLKDDYFNKMQEQIDTVQEASNKQLEKLQTQIDLMTETLEYQKENGLLWQEVYEIMNNWTPEKILQFIEEYTKSYRENSALQNEENSKETLKQLQQWDAKKTRDKDWEDYYNNLDSKYDSVKEAKKQEAYWAYSEGYAKGGKEQAEANANAVFDAALNGGKKPSTTPSTGDNSGSTTPTPAPEPEPATRKAKFKNKNYKVYSYDTYDTKTKGFVVYGNGDDSVQFEMFDEKGERILVSGTDGKGQKIEKRWVPKKYFQYKEGGLVDFTGPAWVDGTKQRPEAFLSAEDTKLLKSKIFSKSDYSLKSTVEAIESMTKSLSNLQASGGSNITIEHAEVNIEPGTISNDYDARRAGEMALEEMVKIARKSGNRTVSRR